MSCMMQVLISAGSPWQLVLLVVLAGTSRVRNCAGFAFHKSDRVWLSRSGYTGSISTVHSSLTQWTRNLVVILVKARAGKSHPASCCTGSCLQSLVVVCDRENFFHPSVAQGHIIAIKRLEVSGIKRRKGIVLSLTTIYRHAASY